MKSVYNFVVTPVKSRYNNTKDIDGKELILNTEMVSYQYVNRNAIVVSKPIVGNTEIETGDEVIVHHNVFRRWQNQYGEEKNSRSYFDESTYLVNFDQIFLYKRNNVWSCTKGYCFVKPLKSTDILNTETETPLVGVVKYSDGTVNVGDLVGFKPNSEYEFFIDGQKLYRIFSHFITIKYEYQGNEKEYNPSWAQGS